MSDFDPAEVLRRSSSGPLGGWSTVRVHRKAALPTAAIAVAARRTPQQHRTVPAVAAVAAAPDAHLGPITAPDRLEAELEKTTAVLSSARQQFSEERHALYRRSLLGHCDCSKLSFGKPHSGFLESKNLNLNRTVSGGRTCNYSHFWQFYGIVLFE